MRRSDPLRDPLHRLVRLAAAERVEVCYDVGANEGQFAMDFRAHGYAGEIVSFEPLACAHERLAARAASDPRWTVASRAAVGASIGSVEINVAANWVSSSLLPLAPDAAGAARGVDTVATEKAPLVTLDEWRHAHPRFAGRAALLKIDTQGYEAEVLEGARHLLADVRLIYLELSLKPLYVGAPRFAEMVGRLAAIGFECVGLDGGLVDRRTAEMREADGIFRRFAS